MGDRVSGCGLGPIGGQLWSSVIPSAGPSSRMRAPDPGLHPMQFGSRWTGVTSNQWAWASESRPSSSIRTARTGLSVPHAHITRLRSQALVPTAKLRTRMPA